MHGKGAYTICIRKKIFDFIYICIKQHWKNKQEYKWLSEGGRKWQNGAKGNNTSLC